MVPGFSNWNTLNNEVNDSFFVWHRVMWMAGCIAAMSSVTYPAISAFASSHASADQQGN